jgi:hypothetical protein
MELNGKLIYVENFKSLQDHHDYNEEEHGAPSPILPVAVLFGDGKCFAVYHPDLGQSNVEYPDVEGLLDHHCVQCWQDCGNPATTILTEDGEWGLALCEECAE